MTKDQLFQEVGELKFVGYLMADQAHKELMDNENEPLDGDDTERVAEFFLERLNELNGNT